jgi:high-affinity nickel permease
VLDGPFLLVGLGLGARHATDPDHVAALWNFVSREHKPGPALRYAALWGLGHATSFTCVGVAILAFGLTPAPWFERITEGLVGLMLLLLGQRREVRHARLP